MPPFDFFLCVYSAVVSDLTDTMESLQTIAEQCLPEAWGSEDHLVVTDSSQETCVDIDLQQLYKCQFCEEIFKGTYVSLLEMDVLNCYYR